MHKPRRSLFGEILDWMLVPLLILWPMSIGVTYLVAQSIANAPFDQLLNDKIKTLAHTMATQTPVNPLQLDALGHVRLQILGKDGQFVVGNEKTLPLPTRDPNQMGIVVFQDLTLDGEDHRAGHMWLAQPETHDQRFILVHIAETLSTRKQLAADIVKSVILPQFVILPLAVLLVWFGLSRGLAPLKTLLTTVHNRKPDDLSALQTTDTPEELLPVIAALNEQLKRLQHTIDTQKRFIADAAHQLKTPLAGLRMQVELLAEENDPIAREQGLRRLKTGTERSTRLANQLLALARTEAPSVLKFEQLDLCHIARTVTRDFVPEAMSKHIDLGVDVPEHPVYVCGQPLMLTEMLKNLMENALRYTPDKGCVTVRIGNKHALEPITLDVEDDGPGIPPTERKLVFDRFYRILGTSADGSGLGLAIVQETAHQHQALVSIHNNPKSTHPERPGTLMRIQFPPQHT